MKLDYQSASDIVNKAFIPTQRPARFDFMKEVIPLYAQMAKKKNESMQNISEQPAATPTIKPTGTGGTPTGNAYALIQKYFPQSEWARAYNVMMGESGGRSGAIGDQRTINGVYAPSYGYFQIRALPGRPAPEQLLNPEFNVQYAANLWKSQGWRPWTVARNLGYI